MQVSLSIFIKILSYFNCFSILLQSRIEADDILHSERCCDIFTDNCKMFCRLAILLGCSNGQVSGNMAWALALALDVVLTSEVFRTKCA